MSDNKDDILETALNSGIQFAANKYSVSESEVTKIVKDFKFDIEDLCSCDKAALRGIVSMCMFCDGRDNRIRV